MDLSHTHSQQADTASLPQPTELSSPTHPSLQYNTTPSDSSRTLRSTTRARAAKQKVAQDNDIPDQTASAPPESSSRQTRSNYHPYPSKRTRDTKGKKRAAPEALSEELSASVPAGPTKRLRPASTAYALRSRSDTTQPSVSEMPKKIR